MWGKRVDGAETGKMRRMARLGKIRSPIVHQQQREPDSMQPEQTQAQTESQIPDSQVQVGVERSHISLIVVSPAFEGLSSVKRQQTVYATLADRIADGSIHAVHMKTFTPQEWQQQQ